MKRISLSCLAILAGVAALACSGPVGMASAQELSVLGAPGAVSAAQTDTRTVRVPFHTSAGIQLGEPSTKVKLGLDSLNPLSYVDGTGAGFTFSFKESAISAPGSRASAVVSWPILQWGSKTDYTVTVRQAFDQRKRDTWCKITDADGQEKGPFHCYLDQQANDVWGMHITDARVIRDVEASGTITAQGVSLADGKFSMKATSSRAADSLVPAGSTSQFDAVFARILGVKGDTASAEFSYNLLENGRYVLDRHGYPLKVKGMVKNERSFWFQPAASCSIEGRDGILKDSGYSCEMVHYHARTTPDDGNVHYITDFTVTKK
jgi:hypothetical protein